VSWDFRLYFHALEDTFGLRQRGLAQVRLGFARVVGGLPRSGAEADEPAADFLRGGLFLGLLAQALPLLALAFVSLGLLLGCDGPFLTVLAQVRV
jgi:hypothetical protein